MPNDCFIPSPISVLAFPSKTPLTLVPQEWLFWYPAFCLMPQPVFLACFLCLHSSSSGAVFPRCGSPHYRMASSHLRANCSPNLETLLTPPTWFSTVSVLSGNQILTSLIVKNLPPLWVSTPVTGNNMEREATELGTLESCQGL